MRLAQIGSGEKEASYPQKERSDRVCVHVLTKHFKHDTRVLRVLNQRVIRGLLRLSALTGDFRTN